MLSGHASGGLIEIDLVSEWRLEASAGFCAPACQPNITGSKNTAADARFKTKPYLFGIEASNWPIDVSAV